MRSDRLSLNTRIYLIGAGLLLTGVSVFCAHWLVPADRYFLVTLQSIVAFGLVAGFVVDTLPRHAPHVRFGVANSVTLGRATIVCLLAGLIGHGDDLLVQSWAPFLLSLGGFVLDGVDGWAARRSGMQSAFGFRFDMEVDAFHILVLSALIYDYEKAGAWVLACGFLRYGFVLAGWLLPWLCAALPHSARRRVVAGLQTGALVVCLAPVVVPPFSVGIAAGGLLLLSYSFAVDVLLLYRRRDR